MLIQQQQQQNVEREREQFVQRITSYQSALQTQQEKERELCIQLANWQAMWAENAAEVSRLTCLQIDADKIMSAQYNQWKDRLVEQERLMNDLLAAHHKQSSKQLDMLTEEVGANK
jgi:hypothetical protein